GWAHTYTAKLEASGVLGTGLTGSDRARSLREPSVEDLFVGLEPAAFGMIFMPTLLSDGYVLPPSDASAVFSNPSGYQQVPIILGSNRDEAALFLMNHDDYRSSLFGLFPRVKNEADYRRVVRYISDATKIRTVDEIADWMLESSHADVFAYRFDWDEQRTILGYDVSVALGAAHGIEVPFVFGSFDMFPPLTRTVPMDEPQSRLSADIMSYWAEFARSGDPGTGGRGENPVWNRWAHSGTRLLILDTESGGGIRMEDVHVDQASLRKALASDSDFKRKQEHCKTYVLAFRGTPEFDSGEYERIGCAEFPVEPVSMF
ncbi:MAG: carboxylesterase family protein, partial [Pseudomonadales bacterium]|nr:carboxylesterase family protein [Pseudomonadales bacterium]